jgi:hypothetical protein
MQINSSSSPVPPLAPAEPRMRPCCILDEHCARLWQELAPGRGGQGNEKVRVVLGALGQRTAGRTHAHSAPGLAARDVEAEHAGAVFTGKSHQLPGGIEHHNAHGFVIERPERPGWRLAKFVGLGSGSEQFTTEVPTRNKMGQFQAIRIVHSKPVFCLTKAGGEAASRCAVRHRSLQSNQLVHGA